MAQAMNLQICSFFLNAFATICSLEQQHEHDHEEEGIPADQDNLSRGQKRPRAYALA